VTQGNGGRDYVYLPEQEGRFLKLVMKKSAHGRGFAIAQLVVKGPEFGASANGFFSAVARDRTARTISEIPAAGAKLLDRCRQSPR